LAGFFHFDLGAFYSIACPLISTTESALADLAS
jgi:hypothetical protein